ncbi:hypothetical protein C8Q74DRAFT_1362549 [Fomes fomentarius]|nr:hypothetical protein C8Q74DRAFT_1362549 [Fomes fomentarius]
MSSDPVQLATDLQSLSLDDQASSSGAKSSGDHKSRPRLVDCRPWPPLEEIKKPRTTAVFYYAIYLRPEAIEQLAIRIDPRLEGESPGSLLTYGLNAARWVADDPSLDIQIGYLRPRHKEAMPFITENRCAPILTLFPMTKEAFEQRLTADKVERLARELDCKPDWFELAFFL